MRHPTHAHRGSREQTRATGNQGKFQSEVEVAGASVAVRLALELLEVVDAACNALVLTGSAVLLFASNASFSLSAVWTTVKAKGV